MDRVASNRILGASKLRCDNNAAAHVKLDSFPAGVRFDPSDEELLEHLAAKIGRSSRKPHPFLDEFIHTLVEEDGICRTHPENLPGVKKDGSSCHYFHRPSMAYTTGTRKRRKIQTDDVPDGGTDVRWHKTGKTRPVSQCGKILGHKKIMVLYRAMGKKSKNLKTNWVMHQYHLGSNEEETDGELVVCKVFFQKAPRSCPSRKMEVLAVDDEDCEPSESDIGFQAPGLSGYSPSVSVVTRGLPPLSPLSCKPSRTAKQLYAEPTESNSEIFDPQLLATQSKQKAVFARSRINQYNDEGIGEDIGVDMNHKATACVVYKPGGSLVQTMRAAVYADNQDTHINGGLSGHLSREGEDESFQAVNLDEEGSWGLDQVMEAEHIEQDPSIMGLLCDEHLDGDPLAEDANYEDFNFRSLSYDVGCSVEEELFRVLTGVERSVVDPALDALELDTPPDMLEYPVVTSQEVKDWLGKHPILGLDNTDSQSTT
ncbi:uncharacterized protein [Physcomitrium patens]|uniref:NAC domain-containing protein n=1 Tax=Physcomitrium patens TaxID=3218 RepID=A0A2K1ILP6_PHYPA|nr:uncharacterized protein LOC112275234 isoform X2 [Physcomitrium patens]PNR30196.1 hypothetical protein PHYPA_026512 [Physcomitrium patens]BCZ85777.1 DNA-damage responsive transcription factor [Physcomitrium patens]|eukprot:XP_024361187.1 uncharacterized protein LOC112275234 isoform X2 [Physcomitrella patens]